MKKLLYATLALVCAMGLTASAQMTTITASSIKMAGTTVASGTVTFIPVNSISAPISLTAGGTLYDAQGFTAAITNGSIASGFSVPDACTSYATAPNTQIYYQATIVDSATRKTFSIGKIPYVCGETWALDSYTPTQTAQVSPTGLLSGPVVPTRCSGTSVFYIQSGTPLEYVCVGGSYVQVSGSGGSGTSATVEVGTTTTGAAGTQASVSNSGTSSAAVLNFTIPKGDKGDTGTTGAAGAKGDKGDTGDTGPAGPTTAATDSALGAVQLASGQSNSRLAKVATTGSYRDLSSLPTAAAIPTGALADYNFLDGSGTSVADNSGNGNNGTLCASTCTAPTWTATGLQFGAADGTNKTAGVSLPAALNATKTYLFVAYQEPIVKALPPVNLALLLTSSAGTSGFNILSEPTDPDGTQYENTGYSLGTFTSGSTTNAASNRYTGLHVLAFVCGTGSGNVDHMYIDGVETVYAHAQGASCGAQSTGNLFLGNSAQTTPWSAQGGMIGKMYRAIFWSTQLTAAQVAQASLAAIVEVQGRGVVPSKPVSPGAPKLFAIGDSITYGYGASTPWPSLLSLTNQPAWSIENWGISSLPAKTVSPSEPNRIAPMCGNSSDYQSVAIVAMGTNDFGINAATYQTGLTVWRYLTAEGAALKAGGCKVFVGTMLSRTGTSTNSQTWDYNKNDLNTKIVSGAKIAGFDGVIDFAADTRLGADGAYSSSTYFQADGTHPTQAGQQLLADIASRVLNYYYSPYISNPHLISATATLTSADAAVEISSPSSSVALTLPTCVGPSGATYTITNPQSSQTVTVIGASTSEPINGLTTAVTIAANSTIALRDVPNARSTGGCHWVM